jgi:hypothetical protein
MTRTVNSRRLLENEWQSCRHQRDALATGGEALVQLTGFVRESARERIRGHNAQTDFVADEDLLAREIWQAVEERRPLPLEVSQPGRAQQVRQPQRETVNEDDAIDTRHPAKRRGEVNGLFDHRPVVRTSRSVGRNPRAHLLVVGGGGGGHDYGDGTAVRARKRFRMTALSRPYAAEYQSSHALQAKISYAPGSDSCGFAAAEPRRRAASERKIRRQTIAITT